MTVDNTSPLLSLNYTGPGRYDFYCLVNESSHLIVTYIDTLGALTQLIENLDYTVVINTLPTIGGYLDVVTPLDTSGTIEINRVVPIEQPRPWAAEGFLNLDLLEKSLDEIVMIIQQLSSTINDSWKTPIWRGNYIAGTYYESLNIVYVSTGATAGLYMAETNFTSVDIATDIAADNWRLILDVAALVPGEASLGNPDVSGKVLASTIGGVRSWVAKENAAGNPTVDGMALLSSAAGARSWGFQADWRSSGLSAPYIQTYSSVGVSVIENSPVKAIAADGVTVIAIPASGALGQGIGIEVKTPAGTALVIDTLYILYAVKFTGGTFGFVGSTTKLTGPTGNVIAYRAIGIFAGQRAAFFSEGVTYTSNITLTTSLTTSLASYSIPFMAYMKDITLLLTAAAAGYVTISLAYGLSITVAYTTTDTNKLINIPIDFTLVGAIPTLLQMKYTTANISSVKIVQFSLSII